MHMRFQHLVDCINKHELAIEYIPTGEICADGLTKGLGGVKHGEFLNMIHDGTTVAMEKSMVYGEKGEC